MTATSTSTTRNDIAIAMWPSVRPQVPAVETGRVPERDAGHATGTYISSLNPLRWTSIVDVSITRGLSGPNSPASSPA